MHCEATGVASNIKAALAPPRMQCSMPRNADSIQCAVGCQRPCKLRSASITKLVEGEIELCRAGRSRHSV